MRGILGAAVADAEMIYGALPTMACRATGFRLSNMEADLRYAIYDLRCRRRREETQIFFNLECAGMTALWNGETCLAVGKRRPVAALHNMAVSSFIIHAAPFLRLRLTDIGLFFPDAKRTPEFSGAETGRF